jgi:hypothetical protein
VSKSRELTEAEDFQAMASFLEDYWERGKSEEIAILLGSLVMQPDGKPVDAALARDWSAAVRRVVSRRDGHAKDAA